MRLPLVRQGINHVVGYLEKVTQISNIDMNQDGLISWFGYRPGMMRNAYYPMEYQQLIDTQQYSLLLSDGSFFQFYFSFEEQNLTAARLAYYPKPLSTIETQDDIFSSAEEALDREDITLYEHLYNWVELMDVGISSPANTSHIRFDYDPKAKSHCPSHLQFGAIQEFRIPADFVPQPLAFVEFCKGLCSNAGDFEASQLGFARNNRLILDRDPQTITLGSLG